MEIKTIEGVWILLRLHLMYELINAHTTKMESVVTEKPERVAEKRAVLQWAVEKIADLPVPRELLEAEKEFLNHSVFHRKLGAIKNRKFTGLFSDGLSPEEQSKIMKMLISPHFDYVAESSTGYILSSNNGKILAIHKKGMVQLLRNDGRKFLFSDFLKIAIGKRTLTGGFPKIQYAKLLADCNIL